MSSAQEARYRINAPNSLPRATKIIALDAPSEHLVKRLARAKWNGATFFTATAFASTPRKGESLAGWLSDLAGRTKSLVDEVNTADQVVMIATAGEDVPAASLIGEACSLKRVMTTALIAGSAGKSDAVLSKTLAQLRPWALMLVIANSDDYIEDMLTALRA
jgi:hypothetical protein